MVVVKPLKIGVWALEANWVVLVGFLPFKPAILGQQNAWADWQEIKPRQRKIDSPRGLEKSLAKKLRPGV